MKNFFIVAFILFSITAFSQVKNEMDPSYVEPQPQVENNQTVTTYNKANDHGIIKGVWRLNYGTSVYNEFENDGFSANSFGIIFDIPSKINETSSLDFNWGIAYSAAFADDWRLTNNIDDVNVMSVHIGLGYGYYLDKYLKLSTGIGYAYEYGTFTNTGESFYSSSYDFDEFNGGAFYYAATVDWFITPKFGINLRYDTFQNLSFGIQFKVGRSK